MAPAPLLTRAIFSGLVYVLAGGFGLTPTWLYAGPLRTDQTADLLAFITGSHAPEVPLHMPQVYETAIENKVYSCLLQAEPTTNWPTNEYGNTLLHLAGQYGYERLLSHLLFCLKLPPCPLNLEEQTPLHLAAAWGQTGAIQMLLKAGADPDAYDAQGRTPSHFACAHGHFESVQALLAAGANLYCCNHTGEQPAYLAARNGHAKVLQVIMEQERGRAPSPLPLLQEAIKKNCTPILECLLILGLDVEERDSEGNTALHLAHALGDLEAVRILEQYGADPRVVNHAGLTPQQCVLPTVTPARARCQPAQKQQRLFRNHKLGF